MPGADLASGSLTTLRFATLWSTTYPWLLFLSGSPIWGPRSTFAEQDTHVCMYRICKRKEVFQYKWAILYKHTFFGPQSPVQGPHFNQSGSPTWNWSNLAHWCCNDRAVCESPRKLSSYPSLDKLQPFPPHCGRRTSRIRNPSPMNNFLSVAVMSWIEPTRGTK